MFLIPIHIAAGLTALAAGVIALYAAKGATLHRKSGKIFVYAMIIMASSGAVMSIVLSATPVNVITATLTTYLVCTGLFAVRRTSRHMRWLDLGFMLLGLTVVAATFSYGFMALASSNKTLDSMPAEGYFVFGTIALAAVLGDLRLLFRGLPGVNRITRHLWRLGVALFVAAGSFFLGQADEFPQAVQDSGLLGLPVLAVVLTTLFWWLRVSFTRWYHRDYLKIPTDVPTVRAAAE